MSAPDTTVKSGYAVVGSGLAAVGCILALKRSGIKPTVIDVGVDLASEVRKQLAKLAVISPQHWSEADRRLFLSLTNQPQGVKIPSKTLFGHDYFYGKSCAGAVTEATGNSPPYSYALGGLSVAWGGAVLPAHSDDLMDWPITADELNHYSKIVLEAIPYSACDDRLSNFFPLLGDPVPLEQTNAEKKFLSELEKANLDKGVVFGQARLLTDATGGKTGCRYCGQCLTGCVYGSIYKAGDHILDMITKSEIDYVPGSLVSEVHEHENCVEVKISTDAGQSTAYFDRVFLAAGAVNTTRIIMRSRQNFGENVKLLSRGGFVVPMWSWRKIDRQWPSINTQPGVFIETKTHAAGHWVHTQVSLENEVLLEKLGLMAPSTGLAKSIRTWISQHLFVAFVNYHSDDSGFYNLQLDSKGALHSEHVPMYPRVKTILFSLLKLGMVFARIGCIPVAPLIRLNSGSYHVGGSLPMRKDPSSLLETDISGRPSGFHKVHAVDSSVFPSLPGTTIGLVILANAYRIAELSTKDV